MWIVLLVTGIAIRGRSLKNLVDVAGLTRDSLVPSFELEGRQAMIEPGVRPAILRVAVSAVLTQLSLVRVILLVT
jgi:hypothetical protein